MSSITCYIFTCLLAYFSGCESYFMHIQPLSDLYKLNRVIGGRAAANGEFPHQVSLQWGNPPYILFSHVCGGSIISEKWILTAGHCVNNLPTIGQFVIKAGKNYIKSTEETEQVGTVERIIIHERYQGSVSPYDIALIKLTTPFTFNNYVSSIGLPAPNVLPTGNAILSGWGSISRTRTPILPEFLQKVTLPIIDLNTCRHSLKLLGEPWDVHDTNLCTGPLTGSFSACNGDSGGPLIQQNEYGTSEVIGIVSWGLVPCGAVGSPAVFVRVSAFIEWIYNTMRIYYY